MKEEHGPVHLSTFNNGASTDKDPELAFSKPADGKYYDGRNMHIVSAEGHNDAAEKIHGETIQYSNSTGLSGYKCIGSVSVNLKLVEFWVDAAFPPVQNTIVKVDGVVVLNTPTAQFPLSVNFPLQIHKNESKTVSEIFVTDNNIAPFIFDINDMLDALTTNPNKYFSAFDFLLYEINLQSPLDIPAFIELKNVGGGGGLPVGQYQYQMRYVNDEGDRTNWSQATPMIPIVESLSNGTQHWQGQFGVQQTGPTIYPWVKSYGGPPNPSSLTGYAIHLRFRVTNIYNYQFIEIKRLAYNAGAGITFSPNGVIVAKIAISPGEISVREYFDPSEANTDIAISETDETQVISEIVRAKAIRYFDRRTVLMNVEVASKESNLGFLQINGKEGFPVIENMGKAGHNDPWNHTYKKSQMRGEKAGYGIVCIDGVGAEGFVTKIPQLEDFQFPNRRDPISNETRDFSLNGTVRAADTGVLSVSQTHEVYDLSDAVAKSDVCSFKNIIRKGQVAGLTGTKQKSTVAGSSSDCNESEDGEIENHGAHVDLLNDVSVSYQPYHPVRQGDPDITGHNYVTDVAVYDKGIHNGEQGYRPYGFGPNYYSMGMCVAGVNNFPKWAKAFSVVRSEPITKRVVCQGLGFYSINPAVFKTVGNKSLATKDLSRLWFYSPDIENGIVSSNTLNDIIDNPQNYALQFVSPQGFFSEVYGFEHKVIDGERDRLNDMIAYVRMLRDDPNNWRINPAEDSGMGIADGGLNYVRYDKYRNTGVSPGVFQGDPNQGNKTFDIAQVNRVSEGRGKYLSIETYGNFYATQSVGGVSDKQFADQGLKDWTEPVYTINIIRVGADIPDKDIQGFRQTTHYQKLESIIGKGNGLPNQKFILVDERWEDCIPAPDATKFGANINRFIFIKRTTGVTETWVNGTFMTTTQISLITANITAFGFDTVGGVQVQGIYTHENIDNQSRFYNIVFDVNSFIPQAGDLILVRYDNTAPIRVFGGDSYIGEAIFAPIDRLADAKSDVAETQFAMGIGLPFFAFKMNPRHYAINNSASAVNVIQDGIKPELGYIRQLCVMFTCETRCGLHYAYNADYPNQFFPLINYVMRPNRWDDKKSITDNGIYKQYEYDYGANEQTQWQWGGFRFLQQVNPDYACEPPVKYFSRPEFGFVEKTKFFNRIMWSLPRTIEAQSSPSLKTFPANNSFDIDDGQGEIKFAWDATTAQRGENIYAITNKGICLAITKKSILSDLNAGEIGYMAADGFIKGQIWLTKDVGMLDEWWRSAAEAFVPVEAESGTATRTEALFFCNNESAFMLSDNTVKDVGRLDYFTRIYNQGIVNVLPGYQTPITAVYDKYFQEYWIYMGGEIDTLFVFGKESMCWYGVYDFKFDRFTVVGLDTYGSRNLETYLLHDGQVINGAPIVFELMVGASPEQFVEKEAIRIRVNSPENQKPTRVEFYKEATGPVQCSLDGTNPAQGLLYMKNYRGWEGFIPRIQSSVNPGRPRLQARKFFYKIIHDQPSDFKVVDAGLQYKLIKG